MDGNKRGQAGITAPTPECVCTQERRGMSCIRYTYVVYVHENVHNRRDTTGCTLVPCIPLDVC